MSNKKIGLLSLTALVLSSMIGSGIFSLPQNMAQVASGQALLIVWLITGVGIIFLGLSFFLFHGFALSWTVGFILMLVKALAIWQALCRHGLLAVCNHWHCGLFGGCL